jgi:hypothetical protein
MSFPRRLSLFVLFICWIAPTVAGQGARQRLEADIRFLADDLLEGRGTPSRGLDIAALYLAEQLRALGWKPGTGESYFQKLSVGAFSPQAAKYSVELNGVHLEKDEYTLLPFGFDPSGSPVEYPLVFTGYGLFVPEKGIDEYGDVALDGKAAVALQGAPWEADNLAPHSYDRMLGKSAQATIRKAGCLVYVSHEFDDMEAHAGSPDVAFAREMAQVPYSFVLDFGEPTMGLGPILAINSATFDRVLAPVVGNRYAELREPGEARGQTARPIDASLVIGIETEVESGTTSNVVAVLEGVDPALRDEWVVLTAHYDHLGFKEVTGDEDGVWNGADDNASGTAALLEIARRMKKGEPPRRSVMLMFTAGEDRGLLGSAYYSKHPLIPFEKVAVNINVDMVGRSEGDVTAYTVGAGGVFDRAREMGQQNGISVKADPFPAWRIIYFIDSYHFARFDVPFVEIFTEMHEDYHQPSDETHKINFEKLVVITDLVEDLTDYYASGGKREQFDRPSWFRTP